MKNIALAAAVFIVLLVSLSFGERIGVEVFSWLSYLTALALNNLQDVVNSIQAYLQLNWGKVALALVLTLPISYWLRHKNRSADPASSKTSKRKVAIFLAVFLGWAGVHRFYVGQLGWGLMYLVLFYLFAPLSVLLGWIDAIRYLLMSDEEFALL